MTTLEICKKIIEKKISSQYLDEANRIIELTDNDYRQQLIELDKIDNGNNAICLILDKMKYELVLVQKMQQISGDGFGRVDYYI